MKREEVYNILSAIARDAENESEIIIDIMRFLESKNFFTEEIRKPFGDEELEILPDGVK